MLACMHTSTVTPPVLPLNTTNSDRPLISPGQLHTGTAATEGEVVPDQAVKKLHSALAEEPFRSLRGLVDGRAIDLHAG